MLDVACGNGRHARWLLGRGYRVFATDVDVSGLADLRAGADLEILAADLENGPWPLGGQRFDGIVVTNYLHRPHFPLLATALAADGVLIIETFGEGNERLGRPRNPFFLLRPGELLEAFGHHPLQVVAYEHGIEQRPRPAVRQRLCATNSREPVELPERPDPSDASRD